MRNTEWFPRTLCHSRIEVCQCRISNPLWKLDPSSLRVSAVIAVSLFTWVTRRIATCATSHEAHKRQVGQVLRWQIATWATREKLGNPRGRGGKLPREKRHFGASHVGPGGSGGMAQVRVSPASETTDLLTMVLTVQWDSGSH